MSLRERLLSRLNKLMQAGGGHEHAFRKHVLRQLDPTDLTPLAQRIEQEIEAYVILLVPKTLQPAVLDRPFIAEHWHVFSRFKDVRANWVDANGIYCTWHDGILEYDKEQTENTSGGESINTADHCVTYDDGKKEDLDTYLERTFYTPDNAGDKWQEFFVAESFTTGDWVGVALYDLSQHNNDHHPCWPYWPTDVSAQDLANALGGAKDKDAQAISKALLKGKTRLVSHCHFGTRKTSPEPDLTEVRSSLERWDLDRCAIVVSALKQVEADRHIPTIKMSAKPHARAAFRMLAEGPPSKGGASNWSKSETGLAQNGDFELVWDGKKQPYQLSLLADEPLSAGIVKAIQEELQDDGIRDWLAYHLMAETQGGTGEFRWTWREHREIAGYDRRLRNKTARTTDAELAASCVARIGRFAHAEARIKRQRGDRIYWVRIGDHGLLDVPAGIEELTENGWLTTVAAIRLNRAIYAGARNNERQPYYTLIHESIIALPRIERTLGTLLAFDWRYARDDNGVVVRNARTLWNYARIQGGQWEQQKRWPEARRSLDHALDVLGEKMGLNWHAEADGGPHGLNSPATRYTLESPAWFRDRLIHGVSPVIRCNTAGVPRNGAELAQWRTEHGLSLRHVAALVGVRSQVTIRNAEQRLDAPIPAEWMALLANKRRG